MKISSYTGGMVATNGYLVETPNGNFLIDAPDGVAEWLDQQGTRIDDVLLTHQHYDHVEGAAALKDKGARLHAFAHYSTDLTLETAARQWGMPISVTPHEVDAMIDPTKPLTIAGVEITVSHVPGHATDGLTFYLKDANTLFSGDTLFAGSVGRTDLPNGSSDQLIDGIKQHVMTLPAETRVLSGHGPETSIGQEISSNPFLQ